MKVLPVICELNKIFLVNFVSLMFISVSRALYSSDSQVVELTDSNFNKLVVGGEDVWLVEFYAPWCGHCQQLVPHYTRAAKALKGVVKVGAVDCDVEKSVAGRYGVRGFPTIKIFAADKASPQEFSADRTAEALVNAALAALKEKVLSNLGIRRDGSKQGGGGGGGGSGGGGDGKDVVELTDSNFESKVLKSEEMWLVEFYAPWCGHCRNLAPHWADAATQLKGKVKLGALDATVHTIKANEYSVKGYPTIKFYPAGQKDRGSVEDYTGDRTTSGIVTWALDKLAHSLPPPEIKQIVGSGAVREACEEKAVCVISVLPHILDCQADCRQDYLSILAAAGDRFKSKMWGWLWSEAGQQPELESALDMGGFGYPAMAALNAKKMKYSLFKGAFSKEGINEFLRDLSFGRGSTAPVRGAKLPEILDQEPWDGRNGELPQEEDIDLSDVDLGEEPPNDEL